MMNFKNKKVLITGATGGIGKAILEKFLSLEATILCTGTNEEKLKNLKKDFPKIYISKFDISEHSKIDEFIDNAYSVLGGIDVLINNAGLGAQSLLVEMDDAEWSRVIDVTLNGTMRCTRAALKTMQKNNKGVIVNNASVLGWRAQSGQSHYAAAKAGVMAFTRCVAVEAAEYNIRVNCVAPSLAMHPNLAKSSNQDLIDSLIEKEVMGRAAEPWEIANVMVFLASEYSSYMTGEVISVSSQHP